MLKRGSLVAAGTAVVALACWVAVALAVPPGTADSFTDITTPGTNVATTLPPLPDGSTRSMTTVDGNFNGVITGQFHATILRVTHPNPGGTAVSDTTGVDFCFSCTDRNGNKGMIANHLLGVTGATTQTVTGPGLGGLANDRGTFALLRVGTPAVTTDTGYFVTSPDCLTGLVVGPQVAGPTDSLCFGPGALVVGPVWVSGGGELFSRGATIVGPVTVTGASAVAICGSNITGPLSITGSVGPTLVGEPYTGDCDGNTITGPVTLASDTVGLDFSGNTLTGSFSATGNTGGFVFGDFSPNTIIGPVETSGNR